MCARAAGARRGPGRVACPACCSLPGARAVGAPTALHRPLLSLSLVPLDALVRRRDGRQGVEPQLQVVRPPHQVVHNCNAVAARRQVQGGRPPAVAVATCTRQGRGMGRGVRSLRESGHALQLWLCGCPLPALQHPTGGSPMIMTRLPPPWVWGVPDSGGASVEAAAVTWRAPRGGWVVGVPQVLAAAALRGAPRGLSGVPAARAAGRGLAPSAGKHGLCMGSIGSFGLLYRPVRGDRADLFRRAARGAMNTHLPARCKFGWHGRGARRSRTLRIAQMTCQ